MPGEESKDIIIGKNLQKKYIPGSAKFSTQEVNQHMKCTHNVAKAFAVRVVGVSANYFVPGESIVPNQFIVSSIQRLVEKFLDHPGNQ